ncbi:MAG: cation:proton antiporter [Curtobacterium sp.]
MDPLIVAIGVVVLVVIVTAFSPRVGVAGRLVLVVIGVIVSFLSWVPRVEVDPEIILSGVLPPLLYSSAVSMPSMDFRRDFRPISALSVILVVLSAVAVGVVLSWLIPGLGLPAGIALGAIVSPTDAVATSIARHLGVPSRVVTVLEGESLLNDATALVLLRAAIAATAGTVSVRGIALQFAFSVIVAVVIGVLVGAVNLRIRRALRNPAASTAISFVVPFVASIPAEALGASVIVAAVAAGLVTGSGLARYLRPQDRSADEQNRRTIELLLEGGIFLLMGLQVHGLLTDLRDGGGGGALRTAVLLGAAVAGVVILVRALHVTALLLGLGSQAKRRQAKPPPTSPGKSATGSFLVSGVFSSGERAVIIWAGMRGAVTVAAAQTLPDNTPHRALLILIAFVVAAGTLLQGGTLPTLVKALRLTGTDPAVVEAERGRLLATINQAGASVLENPGLQRPNGDTYDAALARMVRGRILQAADVQHQDALQETKEQGFEPRLAVIDVQRRTLLKARQAGTYTSSTLRDVLAALDAEQIAIELNGGLPAQLNDPGD